MSLFRIREDQVSTVFNHALADENLDLEKKQSLLTRLAEGKRIFSSKTNKGEYVLNALKEAN